MKLMELTHRIVSTATFPLQLVIHPIDTAQKGLETFKQTGSSILQNVKTSIPFLRHITPLQSTQSTTSESSTLNNVDNHSDITEVTKNTLLERVYVLVTGPLKPFLYEYQELARANGNQGPYNALAFVANLVHRMVLFLFGPTIRQKKHNNPDAKNETSEILDNNQPETVNKDSAFDNEYNHKTEYLTKLNREKRGTTNSVSSKKGADSSVPKKYEEDDGEPKVDVKPMSSNYNERPDENLSNSSKKSTSSDSATVCNICGFESQNSCSNATNPRGDFECERVQYKSQIQSILTKIRNLEQDNVSTSKSTTSKSGKKVKRAKKAANNV